MLFHYLKFHIVLLCYISLAYAEKNKTLNDGGELTENDNKLNNDATPEDKDMDKDMDYINDSKIENKITNNNSWLSLKANEHFLFMDQLDDHYAKVRNNYQKAVENNNFDEEMLEVMRKTRGKAARDLERESNYFFYYRSIPAGFNLGSHCMMRTANSIIFFNRIKLRNDTHFRVNYLHNDLTNMVLNAHISLNDLHLIGSYDRAITDKDPSVLFYRPTYGEMEILLKEATYKMEGRYRLLKDRLNIELVISEIKVKDVMITYLDQNQARQTQKNMLNKNIEELVDRIKTKLDDWLKDYFNDYLMYFGLTGSESNAEFQEYNQKKTIALNNYMDNSIESLKKRLYHLKAGALNLPDFTFYGVTGTEIKLKNGVLRGLDTMYRRSVATGKKENNIRKVNANVGFNNLKMTYKYDALVTTGVPPVSGLIILAADDVLTHLELELVKEPDVANVNFQFRRFLKPTVLSVEGPANRLVANFKHMLDHHILSLLTNNIIYNIHELNELNKYAPNLNGHTASSETLINEENVINGTYDDNEYETSSKNTNIYTKPDNAENMKHENETDSKPNDTKGDISEHKATSNIESEDISKSTSKEKRPQKEDNLKVKSKPDSSDYVLSRNDSIEIEVPDLKGVIKKKNSGTL